MSAMDPQQEANANEPETLNEPTVNGQVDPAESPGVEHFAGGDEAYDEVFSVVTAFFDKIKTWMDALADKLVVILLLVIAFMVLHHMLRLILARAQAQFTAYMAKKSDLPSETNKRVTTLFGIINKTLLVGLWAIAVLVTLSTIGVQIGPVLAAAGVLGLAVSFGAQSLVRDILSGVFILVENQVRVGDVAIINGQGGLVEQINMRTIVLRDLQGVVHVFPNGSINTLSNMTKDWSATVLDVGVAYKEDPDQIIEVLKELGAEMRKDDVFGPKIIADIEVFGVEAFEDSAVNVRCRIKTLPIEQWNVAREFRRRLKKTFDARGIEIPFPHRTLYFGEASKEFMLAVRDLRGKNIPEAPSDPPER